jgi:LmbE family N-acetylglucosaminyl deacetylase
MVQKGVTMSDIDSLSDSLCIMGVRRIAVVVAHQDDEALWFGGLLTELVNRGFFIAELITTTKPAPDRPDTFTRLTAFSKVAAVLETTATCLGFDDCAPHSPPLLRSGMQDTVSAVLRGNNVHAVVTHGEEGEPCGVYPGGHRMHKITYAATANAAARLGIPCLTRAVKGQWSVDFDPTQKRKLLDFYAPQWYPDPYPWRESEQYILL